MEEEQEDGIMKVIDVYEGYFASEGVFSGVARRGAQG